jgi:hypothetical protein
MYSSCAVEGRVLEAYKNRMRGWRVHISLDDFIALLHHTRLLILLGSSDTVQPFELLISLVLKPS